MKARFSEVSWVLDWLPDVKADFRRFYNILNIYELDSQEFLSLAYRLQIYGFGTYVNTGEKLEQVPTGMVAFKFLEIDRKRKKAFEDREISNAEAEAFAAKFQPM